MKVFKTILYWVVSCTWGALMTCAGAAVAVVLIALGYKPKRFHYNIYFEVGVRWGGLSLGAFFFVSWCASDSIKRHEAGHGIQNLIFGALFPVLIGVPSAVRYWYRRIVVALKPERRRSLPDYDAVWFERQATRLGEKYFV